MNSPQSLTNASASWKQRYSFVFAAGLIYTSMWQNVRNAAFDYSWLLMAGNIERQNAVVGDEHSNFYNFCIVNIITIFILKLHSTIHICVCMSVYGCVTMLQMQLLHYVSKTNGEWGKIQCIRQCIKQCCH